MRAPVRLRRRGSCAGIDQHSKEGLPFTENSQLVITTTKAVCFFMP